MTEAEQIALAMVNAVRTAKGFDPHLHLNRAHDADEALCRAIEQHEAFKREVSEAVERMMVTGKAYDAVQPHVRGVEFNAHCRSIDAMRGFIIKPPVDPLVEAFVEYADGNLLPEEAATELIKLNKALAARGLQITEIGQ